MDHDLLFPPGDSGRSPQLAAPEDALFGSEPDYQSAHPLPEPMPGYIQDMLEIAGVPRSMGAGESLQWTDACNTSGKYLNACASVLDDASGFELRLQHLSGARQCLRCNRYGDLMLLEDSRGVSLDTNMQSAIASFLLDFAAAVRGLLITH